MTARSAAGWQEEPGHRIIKDAFALAGRAGTQCRPVHLMQALSEADGPIGKTLDVLRPRPADRPGRPMGAGSTYVFGQTQGAAARFAAARGEPMDAPHLLVALLDQGDPETMGALAGAHVNVAELRQVALRILGAPTDLPAIPIPPPTPAGTLDRPPLDSSDLDPRAWRLLSWRQDHLPLDRVSTSGDAAALRSMEQRAAWRTADRAGVDDDQRYSLISRHQAAVDQRLGSTHPELVRPRLSGHISGGIYDRRSRRRGLPNFMVGWPTWFGNRGRGLRDRWFRVKTRSAFGDQPDLDT